MEFLSTLALPVFFVGVWGLVLYGIARLGGWHIWAQAYSSDLPDNLVRRHMCALRMGRNGRFATRYNGVITVGVNADGVYLRPFFPFSLSHAGLFLPFVESQGVEVGGGFEITAERLPGYAMRVSTDLGRWIEETAMSLRGS